MFIQQEGKYKTSKAYFHTIIHPQLSSSHRLTQLSLDWSVGADVCGRWGQAPSTSPLSKKPPQRQQQQLKVLPVAQVVTGWRGWGVWVTVVFTDEEKESENEMREERGEIRYLPLIPSVIITAVIYCGNKERNRAMPSLRSLFSTCFSAERYQRRRAGVRARRRQKGGRTSETNSERGKRQKKDGDREDESLFPTPKMICNVRSATY